MFKIEVTISTADEAARANQVFAAIADVFGGDSAVPAVRAPARRTTKAPAASTAAPDVSAPATDPVAQYLAAGGALPAETIETPAAETIEAPAVVETPAPAADARSLEEKLAALREHGRPAGVTWLRGVLKEHKVERISDLPEPAVDALLAGFEKAVAA